MAQSILSGVLSFVAEGVIVCTSDGTITLVNPHASLLLDYTSDELTGKHVDDMLALTFDSSPLKPKERITYVLFTAEKVFTVPRDKVAYLTSRSGRKFPVFISARSFPVEGNMVGVLVFRDITNEKELEKYKNNTARRLSELTPFLQRAATGDFSIIPEIPYQEDEFTELLVGLRLMTEDLHEAKRITEEYSGRLEKQVEEKTQEIVQARIHTETIIENLTDGLLEYDDEFTLLRINRAAETLLGVDREEVVGKEILPKDTDKKHWQSIINVLHPALSSTARKVKYPMTRFNAEVSEITVQYPLERELQIITVPITERTTGKQQGFIKIVRDITREKSISRSKSEFISIAAHQLRTPLSAIKWTLHMVLNDNDGPLNAAQRELLHNGYETNEKMIQLVNDLLNVARIEEGRFGYDFKKGDIMSVIQNVIEFVKVPARERGIEIEMTSSKEGLPLFIFDTDKVTLALENLVDNAVKYTLAGGKVSLDASTRDEYLEIKVQDTGIGIPQKQINMLFTKFFRADNALHMQTSGSGLGLYLAKNIAMRHGGSLRVESKEGAGSVFFFRLPLQAERIPKGDISLDEM